MTTYWLRLRLLSDTTFGRGDGVAGLVDAEVQHDPYGLPYLGGKTLKGLLVASCAEVLTALALAQPAAEAAMRAHAQWLFGSPGSTHGEAGHMRVGDAELPADLRAAIAREIATDKLKAEDVLHSLTTIRRQTAMEATTGAPRANTLRAMRVILRDMAFDARLTFDAEPGDDTQALLAACAKALRRAGSGRNRGRGRIDAQLFDVNPVPRGNEAPPSPTTQAWFERFGKGIRL